MTCDQKSSPQDQDLGATRTRPERRRPRVHCGSRVVVHLHGACSGQAESRRRNQTLPARPAGSVPDMLGSVPDMAQHATRPAGPLSVPDKT
eukprot:15568-Rhodomonas_salina.1